VRVRIQGRTRRNSERRDLFHDFVILYGEKEGQQKVEMEN
jgi:hypothetical protein